MKRDSLTGVIIFVLNDRHLARVSCKRALPRADERWQDQPPPTPTHTT